MYTRTKWLSALVAMLLIVAACGNDDEPISGDASGGDGDEELSGTVRVDGSSTVGPLSEVAAEMFMNATPGVRVDVAISGTSGGFQKFCSGENDMNNASRPIKDEEVELCDENGITVEGIRVSNDALALLVNNENPVECLTVEQATQIWDDGSTVDTWGDIDGLDIPADMAGEALTLYGPGTDSGTFDFFTEEINGESGRIRNDYVDIGEDDAAAVTAVQGDVYAMGYVPYSYFQEAGDSVKPLQIDGGEGCVEATIENVANGSYTPLGRPLFTYANNQAIQRPEVLAFMEFHIEEAEDIAVTAGYVPLTEDQKAEELAKIQALLGN
ncbi:MAG: PstS family phosphate ABC transporter substrate-binding protein [Acidimicrobiales bacterium]|nr:PstS family phosphate ABC transporter substrate-binding protein [Acidimicrobiales bacterium]